MNTLAEFAAFDDEARRLAAFMYELCPINRYDATAVSMTDIDGTGIWNCLTHAGLSANFGLVNGDFIDIAAIGLKRAPDPRRNNEAVIHGFAQLFSSRLQMASAILNCGQSAPELTTVTDRIKQHVGSGNTVYRYRLSGLSCREVVETPEFVWPEDSHDHTVLMPLERGVAACETIARINNLAASDQAAARAEIARVKDNLPVLPKEM